MKKKIVALALATALALGMVSGCGNTSTGNPESKYYKDSYVKEMEDGKDYTIDYYGKDVKVFTTKNDDDTINITFSYDGEEEEVSAGVTALKAAYLMQQDGDHIAVYITEDYEGEYMTYVYTIEASEASCTEMRDCYIDPDSITTKGCTLVYKIDILGTYTATEEVTYDDHAAFLHDEEDENCVYFKDEDGNSPELTLINSLNLNSDEGLVTLMPGDKVKLIKTDRVSVIYFETEDGTLCKGDMQDQGNAIYVMDQSEYRTFQVLPYEDEGRAQSADEAGSLLEQE